MKSIITFLLFSLPFFGNSQTAYNEFQVPNFLPMSEMIIEVEADEAFYVLNDNTAGGSSTYILINKTSVVYTLPVLPTGWTIRTLYKANKSIMPFDVGPTIPIVLDNNGCSYMRIH